MFFFFYLKAVLNIFKLRTVKNLAHLIISTLNIIKRISYSLDIIHFSVMILSYIKAFYADNFLNKTSKRYLRDIKDIANNQLRIFALTVSASNSCSSFQLFIYLFIYLFICFINLFTYLAIATKTKHFIDRSFCVLRIQRVSIFKNCKRLKCTFVAVILVVADLRIN